MHPLTRPAFCTPYAPHVLAPAHTSFLLHVIASQCAHWCGNPFSPQRSLASWLLFGQIRCAFRICPKCSFSFCGTARSTDCHVASLLAMTCRNLQRVRACKDALPGKPVTAYVFAQGAACFLLPLRGCGLPRRFAPRNDMLKLAACPHRQLCPPGANCYALRIRPKYCFLSCPAAGERIATSLRSSQ